MSFSADFWVPGKPRPKGSYVNVPRGGIRPMRMRGGNFYRICDLVMIPSEDGVMKRWLRAIHAAALAVKPKHPLLGPFTVGAQFYFERPNKTKYPDYPIGAADVDKLCRTIGDALTKVIWLDDKQIVAWTPGPEKHYADERGQGCQLTIKSLSLQEELF